MAALEHARLLVAVMTALQCSLHVFLGDCKPTFCVLQDADQFTADLDETSFAFDEPCKLLVYVSNMHMPTVYLLRNTVAEVEPVSSQRMTQRH